MNTNVGFMIARDAKYAKEFHFKNMHVYVNAIFRNDAYLFNKLSYLHDSENIISEGHKVHVYFWNTNMDDERLNELLFFIALANAQTEVPVYIHTPKVATRLNSILDTALSEYRIAGGELKYIHIKEKLSATTRFDYGNWVPCPSLPQLKGYRPGSKLLISWDADGEYAAGKFVAPGKFESIFRE